MNGVTGGRAAAESADIKLNNFLGGAQVGFNYQFDNRFVIGVEADYSRMRLSGYREILAKEATLLAQRNLEAKMDYAFDWMATFGDASAMLSTACLFMAPVASPS